jgi:hypothetical protein
MEHPMKHSITLALALLLTAPSVAHAANDAAGATKLCGAMLSQKYGVGQQDFRKFKTRSIGADEFEVAGMAPFNGEPHRATCSVKAGLVKWVTWS